MTQNSRPIRIRFVFNRDSGGEVSARAQRLRSAGVALAQDVTFTIADQYWLKLRSQLQTQFAQDAHREISNVAQLYKRYVVGATPERSGFNAHLVAAAAPAGVIGVNTSVSVPWAPRSSEYLRAKYRLKGQTRWFKYDGLLSSLMGRGATWEGAFGPVSVQITRKSMSQAEAQAAGRTDRFHTPVFADRGSIQRVSVAQIRVAALQHITREMLPGIADGNLYNMAPDGSELARLLGRDLAYRVRGNSRYVPYRHALDPFLTFVLTRAIPNAVQKRLAEGLNADIRPTGDD